LRNSRPSLQEFIREPRSCCASAKQPSDSISFNANLVFDAECEIILESLVDILCLHDHRRSIADSDGGALEVLFAHYDCHLRRSDVAIDIMVEICRCYTDSLEIQRIITLTTRHTIIGATAQHPIATT
jgi:hypothetical protein